MKTMMKLIKLNHMSFLYFVLITSGLNKSMIARMDEWCVGALQMNEAKKLKHVSVLYFVIRTLIFWNEEMIE